MPAILLRQRHPLVGVLGAGHPRLCREHKQTNRRIPSPPSPLTDDLLPQLRRAELQCRPPEPRGARLGTLRPRALRHPAHGLALVVEHGEQPPVGLERVALGEEPERRAPAHGEHQRVLARRHVQVLEDPLLDVVLHRAGLGAAVERVVAEVGIELGQCEGRGGGVPAGVEEAETTVVEADPAARAAAGGGGVEVGVVLDAEAVDVGRGGVVRVHGEEPGDGGGEERDVGGRAERAARRGERGGAEEVALRPEPRERAGARHGGVRVGVRARARGVRGRAQRAVLRRGVERVAQLAEERRRVVTAVAIASAAAAAAAVVLGEEDGGAVGEGLP
ncbi:Os12g0591101 [Oryza sativa Japonica Group]|uniref:Os12g0591101 protein n=1 Tax=Oryza sativa subsp. japonica TaxID=39947 RepID=A0A0N7KUA6_ORYSJ|nr:Os12g0591101 [Oryza sativa Japonica Group]